MSWGEIFCFSQWLTQAAQANRSSLCRELCRLQSEERYCPKRSKPVPWHSKACSLARKRSGSAFHPAVKAHNPGCTCLFWAFSPFALFFNASRWHNRILITYLWRTPFLGCILWPTGCPALDCFASVSMAKLFFFFFLISAFLSKPWCALWTFEKN